jgi:hypothetical protein
MRWQVAATDNVGITGLQLFINGDPLALDANGTAVPLFVSWLEAVTRPLGGSAACGREAEPPPEHSLALPRNEGEREGREGERGLRRTPDEALDLGIKFLGTNYTQRG